VKSNISTNFQNDNEILHHVLPVWLQTHHLLLGSSLLFHPLLIKNRPCQWGSTPSLLTDDPLFVLVRQDLIKRDQFENTCLREFSLLFCLLLSRIILAP
jgi:hypothetical protein